MIKTIISDLGGVYFTDGTKNAISEISNRFSIPTEKVYKVLLGELGIQYRISKINEKEFWEKAQVLWGTNQDYKLLTKIWAEGNKPITRTVNIIKQLNQNGYEVLFLSNNIAERVDYLEERYHFKQNFKDGIFSHTAKIVKPNIKIYELVLEKTKSKAEEIVYIDDKEECLVPAKRLGMSVIQFKDAERLKQDLEKLGVKI